MLLVVLNRLKKELNDKSKIINYLNMNMAQNITTICLKYNYEHLCDIYEKYHKNADVLKHCVYLADSMLIICNKQVDMNAHNETISTPSRRSSYLTMKMDELEAIICT
jgi:hypothetical protein